MTALLFYAELLPNIRSISLSIVPPTAPNESTRAVVPPGASHLNLYHNDETTTIKLPADSNPSEQTIVVKPRLGEDSFSCRLPVASSPESSTENIAPWSAPELTKESSVSMLCGSCHNPIFTPNTIKTWKDLPSENWADMMDFWHCHKPHEKNGNNEASVTEDTGKYSSFGKGYSASPGTALVDRGYFLFHQQDVEQSIRKTAPASPKTAKTVLRCQKCDASLGNPETTNNQEQDALLWRVNKWAVAISIGGEPKRHSVERFLSAQFLAYTENEGARRLLITNEEDPTVPKLKLWIFNTDITYTHTHVDSPTRGIKVYWRYLGLDERPPATDRLTSSGFEAVSLGTDVFEILRRCLEKSWEAMPADVQEIGEWKAGVLERF